MKLFSLVLVLSIVLMGCSSKQKEVQYESNENGVKSTITLIYEGDDKVVKQTAKNEIIYADSGLNDKAVAKEALDPVVKQYQGVKGITHEIIYNEKDLVEELEVDYAKLDYEKASEIEGAYFEKPEKGGHISLKKSSELFEEMGYKKVENKK